ncbi:N/A [soil metagenome]
MEPIRRRGNALSGRLAITAAPGVRGETVLRERFHSVPFHLSKTYWDGTVLLVQVVNPTAGLFAGDCLEARVAVESGAALLLTSPSACRAHTMAGGHARFAQSFIVEAGAWLELAPELLIPQSRSRYRQSTTIDVADGGEIYFVETLAPGRVAHGETMAYAELDWRFDLTVCGRLAARERASVRPPDRCWMLEIAGWDHAYYATVWAVSPALVDADLADQVEAMQDDGLLVGMTGSAVPGAVCVKVLARSSIVLRRALASVRAAFAPHLPKLASSPRKL